LQGEIEQTGVFRRGKPTAGITAHGGQIRKDRLRVAAGVLPGDRSERGEAGGRAVRGQGIFLVRLIDPANIDEDFLTYPVDRRIGLIQAARRFCISQRLIRAALEYAVTNKRKSLTLVHKGNIQKYTEGAFRNWGYQLAESEFSTSTYTWEQWERTKAARGEKDANSEMDAARKAGKVIIKDAIADIALQQVLTRSDEFDVIATLNLNGDYLSDALAAQVGGIGIAPGGNINYLTGHAVFEATHGTAPKYANLDKVNPGSVILSGEMMFRYMGWTEAADAIITAMDRTIGQKIVTYDFARLMDGAKEVPTSTFGDTLIANL